ncbi:MAG: hypothetical protein IT304_00380 [Dehalococcoidia bacterium]|nr:hypothetical protein [Dehalococcoidia bacterium]
MAALGLRALVLQLITAFDNCDIPYALGGALAFGYHAEPRATMDVDVDVFLSNDEAQRVLDCLASVGLVFERDAALRAIAATDQARLMVSGTPVDLFFANFPLHESCRRRAVDVVFDEVPTKVLSAEDLAVFKALFNRPKDWLDVEQLLLTGSAFDVGYVCRWLDDIVGAEDGVLARFVALA